MVEVCKLCGYLHAELGKGCPVAATPGSAELLAELTELVTLSGDPNVSAAALGIRIRNQRQLYADMKQALRLAAKPAEDGVRDTLRLALENARRDLLSLRPRSDTGSKRARQIEAAAERIKKVLDEDALSTGAPKP